MEAMPEHIKKNFIYRRCWNNVYRKNRNFTLLVTGATGSGKSTTAQKIGQDLDPSFSVDRIVFSAEDFLDLLANKNLKPGACILFDELITDVGGASRNAMSQTNKLLSYVAATFRQRRLICLFCMPGLFQLDKNLRSTSVHGLIEMRSIDYENKKAVADFFWSTTNPRTGESYYKKPRLLNKEENRWTTIDNIRVGLPTKDLMQAYELKKNEFLDSSLKRWHGKVADARVKSDTAKSRKLSVADAVRRVRNSRDKFVARGSVSWELVSKEFGIGQSRSRAIAKLVNMEGKD